MTNEGLQGSLGANTLLLMLIAGTWPYFAFCFARIHAPSKAGSAYVFYGLFGLIVALHFLMLLFETIFTIWVKPRHGGREPALEKMRLLQKLSYFTNWAPLFLELHRFSAYFAEPFAGVKGSPDLMDNVFSRAFNLGRDGFIAFMALLATVSAGAVKDKDLTAYAILFDLALVAAYITDTFVFARKEPSSKKVEADDLS